MKIARNPAVAALLLCTIAAAPVRASAAGLKLGIKPDSLSFGKVQVATVSALKTVTLSNPNSTALGITSITASGPFAISANTCGSTLAPKPATCTVSVTFNPTGAGNPKGTKEPGTLTITDDAEESPQTVNLKGIAFGIAPGPATIFVSNTAGAVTAYPIGSDGDVAPTATISGVVGAYGIALDASGNIYVTNVFSDGSGSVSVYPAGSNGDVTPKAIISGARTKLYYPVGIAVSSTGKIYVANGGTGLRPDVNGYVTVYAAGSNGDVAPAAVIRGSNTGIDQPIGIALDSSGKLFVANNETQPPCCGSVTVYPANSNGNVRPSVTIAGGGLYFPEGNYAPVDYRAVFC